MPYTGTGPGQPTQPQNYFSAAQNLMGSTNPQNAAAGVIGASQAPAIAQSGLSMQQLLSEIGLAVPTANEQAAYSDLGLQYGLANAGIGEQQLGLQQQGLAAQSALSQQQQGIEEQQYGLQMGQYPEQQAEAALQHANAVAQMQDQGAISGTLNTQGYGRERGTEAAQYGFQQQDIARAQQEAQLGQQSELAGYNYSAGDIARSQQNLELTAQANGLSVQQLIAQWQQGLQNIGVQADPTQLYTQYLAQQSGQVGALGAAAAEQGLLSPGSLAQGAMAGGFNPMQLFAGVG